MKPITKFGIVFFIFLAALTGIFFACWYVAELYMLNFGVK